jgi:PII-like signaling protein
MSDCLTLTTYFGERDRLADGRLVGDSLLDVYGRHGVRASVLLRGSEGFGAKHLLRTDRLLTLSEDLPVLSMAVDSPARIEAVLAELPPTGLVTLERSRLLPDGAGTFEAAKLTIFVGRHERLDGRHAVAAVTDLLYRRGLAGATTLFGVDGTRHGRRERARFIGANVNVPAMVVAVGAGSQIAGAIGDLTQLLPRDPLITLERVRVCKRDGALLAHPHELPAHDDDGRPLWQKLTVYTSQAASVDGVPISTQIVRHLRAAGARGATSVRGVWGFHGDHAPHGDRFLALRRHVPVVTSVIDEPERIERLFAIVDELTRERGLVTSEMVPAIAERGPVGELASHPY